MSPRPDGFDTAAAVTRSMLGWGVVAGPFYVVVGLVLALTRDDFDPGRHQLSLLMLGEGGWMQRTNLVLTAIMVLVAAIGFRRATRGSIGGSRVAPVLAAVAVGLLGSAIFAPDPMAGFPAGEPETASASGTLHLVFGLVVFVGLAVAALVSARWFAASGAEGAARWSRIAGGVVLLAFVGGAALSSSSAGVALLWVAVLVAWAWLVAASVAAYRTVPHPDAHRRLADAR